MPGPFPGMDPHIEYQDTWQDFHHGLTCEIAKYLGVRLPDNYVARIDERIVRSIHGAIEVSRDRPDVLIARGDAPARPAGSLAVMTTVEPIVAEVLDFIPEEIRVSWVEIRRPPEMELITVVEVLSPANKIGVGYQE